MIINREVQKSLENDFYKGKVIILTGPRQVGKTTLIENILEGRQEDQIYFLGDNRTDRSKLEDKDWEQLQDIIGDKKIIFIDEAQKIANVGNVLKLMVDKFKTKKQIIATGSSSLKLLSNTQEPLTGRKFVHEIYGLSVNEIFPTLNKLDFDKKLSDLLIYGSYPEVYLSNGVDKGRLLNEITNSYLYKDILELEQVRNPATISKLLQAIALQIGSEVSQAELSNLVGLDFKTVERYIDLLEKNFVIFRLPPYFNNQRKTLSKQNKIFFYDLGIRNTIINNLNPLEIRNDVGQLWENFLISERMKWRRAHHLTANQYFWRTYDGAEVDLVEEYGGKLYGYEFKWGNNRTAPKSWLENNNSEFKSINKENILTFLPKVLHS